MNVLLIGSGGREHALAWAISASPHARHASIARPAMPASPRSPRCVDIDVDDHAAVIQFCIDNDIGLVVIGPEGPLVAGLADDLAAARIKVFGPSKAAARLEGSKGFTKDFCAEFGIPTAAYKRCTDAKTRAGLPRRAAAAGGGEGRRPRRRQGRGHRRDARAGHGRHRGLLLRRLRRGRRRGRDRGMHGRRGGELLRPRRRHARAGRSPRRRTTSAPSTASRAPTPAAWAPIRRRRS